MKRLEQVNVSQGKIDADLNENQNKLESILPEDYNWKKNVIISETDWITGYPFGNSQFLTPTNYGSVVAYIDSYLDFSLDHKFIPFLNIEFITKTPTELEAVGYFEYISETYEANYVEISNGSNLIYRGSTTLRNGYLTQLQLDNEDFPENLTSKNYGLYAEFSWNGDEWKMQPYSGYASNYKLRTLTVRYNTTIWGAESTEYVDTFETNQILDIDELAVTAMGIKREWTEIQVTDEVHNIQITLGTARFDLDEGPINGFDDLTIDLEILYGGSGTCYWDVAGSDPIDGSILIRGTEGIFVKATCSYKILSRISTNETMTVNLLSQHYSALQTNPIFYKKVDGSWVLQSGFPYSFDSEEMNSLPVVVSTQYFTFRGYYLYYTTDLTTYVGITYNVPSSRWELTFVRNPFDAQLNGTFTFLLNPAPIETVPAWTTFHSAYEQHILIKRFKSTDSIKTAYRLAFKGMMVFKVLANNKSSTSNIPVYNDTYTATGGGVTPSYNHTTFPIDFYRPEDYTFQYKIRISLLNPYDFGTKANYEI